MGTETSWDVTFYVNFGCTSAAQRVTSVITALPASASSEQEIQVSFPFQLGSDRGVQFK